MVKPNALLYGDNLHFLTDQDHFASETIDLVYLDPPFKSDANYNVLFKDATGQASPAQIRAFEDTWHWDTAANSALASLMHGGHTPTELASLITTFHGFLAHSPMLAYIVQMAVRLVHLHRVLKPHGSLFLHCDPTASHYLKLVLDAIFGPRHFRNEIVWCYTGPSSPGQKQFSRKHDVIFWYSKSSSQWTFNADEVRVPHSDKTLANYKGGLSGSGFQGADHIIHEGGKIPEDYWNIAIAPRGREYLGYPTQKPAALLKRIILAASSPGDIVLDPFCGCGTTIDAVETINRENPHLKKRRWIGIDITHLAINLIKHRLARFDPPVNNTVYGEPSDIAGAMNLAKDDPFQFQFWACGLVGARPYGSTTSGKKGKKGADRGIDGVRLFIDDNTGPKKILVQVKGGNVGAKDIRDFRGTIERENAAAGIFVSLKGPSRPMRTEAASAGHYRSPSRDVTIPRLQIVTIDTLLSDGTPKRPAGIQLPPGADDPGADRTVKRAARHDAGGLFHRDS